MLVHLIDDFGFDNKSDTIFANYMCQLILAIIQPIELGSFDILVVRQRGYLKPPNKHQFSLPQHD